jgi:hypothetical protein
MDNNNTFRVLTECIVEASDGLLPRNAFDEMLGSKEISHLVDVDMSPSVSTRIIAYLTTETVAALEHLRLEKLGRRPDV